jgi:hypothetical protein
MLNVIKRSVLSSKKLSSSFSDGVYDTKLWNGSGPLLTDLLYMKRLKLTADKSGESF